MKRLFFIIFFASSAVFGESLTSFHLGQQLLEDRSYELAAIEFRRFALETTMPDEQAQAYLYAAYTYIQSGSFEDAENMLRQVEKRSPDNSMLSLLYAESAARRGSLQTALYFLDLLPETDRDLAIFSARRGAEMCVLSGQIDQARSRLRISSADETNALAALSTYESGPRKSPVVGGVLGIIPGAGYWYSGEIANGFRSLILNSVFLFGVVHTAQDEQWGACAAISFFELTWYSGSIYGGIDAANRYNKIQLDNCIDRLDIPTIKPIQDITIPLFQLKVVF